MWCVKIVLDTLPKCFWRNDKYATHEKEKNGRVVDLLVCLDDAVRILPDAVEKGRILEMRKTKVVLVFAAFGPWGGPPFAAKQAGRHGLF